MSYGPGAVKPDFLCDARPDVGVRAAVPPYLALARDDAPLAVNSAFDAERARVLGDGEELLLQAERDLHGVCG